MSERDERFNRLPESAPPKSEGPCDLCGGTRKAKEYRETPLGSGMFDVPCPRGCQPKGGTDDR